MFMKQKIFFIIFFGLYILVNTQASLASNSSVNKFNLSAQERNLTSAVNKNPADTGTSLKLIKLYLDTGQDDRALIELNRIKSKAGNNSKFYIMSANLLLKNGKIDQAEEMAKKAISISYNNPDAFLMLGQIYFEKACSLGNIKENFELKKTYLTRSFDNYYTAYKYSPSSPFAHIGLANAYYVNGQSALARDEIFKAQELCASDAEALYLIGEYYYKTKQYTKAKSYLERSISAGLASKYKTYYMLGTLYEQDGSIENAQKYYLQSLKINPAYTKSQQNLDRLIKVSYKEAESQSNLQKTTTDLFNNLNEELNTVMQADYFLAVDEFTSARDLYIKVLDSNPDNVNAVTGLAELYYAKWAEGFTNSADFVNDSKYILKTAENTRIVIPLTKFKMINQDKMPENVRQKFINLSVSESFDFYDLLNEVRSEFLLGNYEESHDKLQKLLGFNLSNYEKFKVLKSLCYDHDYDDALNLIQDLKKTYYHNDELEPIIKRIKTKFEVVNENLDKASSLINNKDKKLNDFSGAEFIIKQAITYLPTSKKAYLNYVYLLEKQERYKEALDKANICYRLCKIYPDKNTEITEEQVKKIIQNLNQKYVSSETK